MQKVFSWHLYFLNLFDFLKKIFYVKGLFVQKLWLLAGQIKKRILSFHSYLKASIGLTLLAFFAG